MTLYDDDDAFNIIKPDFIYVTFSVPYYNKLT